MARRFIIVMDEPSTETQEAFTTFMKAYPGHWWHWFSHMWIVLDEAERDVGEWSDAIREFLTEQMKKERAHELDLWLFGPKRERTPPNFYVIEVPVGSEAPYAGVAPKDSHDWMRTYWHSAKSKLRRG